MALTNVLVALAAVVGCTALLTGGDWPTAAVVGGSVLGVVLGVVGVLALWNLGVRSQICHGCIHVREGIST